jgi:hypothetical protein
MTTKEMLKGKFLANVFPSPSYVFTVGEFKIFVNQLCKEQRENCAEEAGIINLAWYDTVEDEWVVDKDSILTAKQPEV